MPLKYGDQVVAQAFELYLQGLSAEEIAHEMRLKGYPGFNPATLTNRSLNGKGEPKGWIHRFKWDEARAKVQAQRLHSRVDLSAEALEGELLESQLNLYRNLETKISSAESPDKEDVQLLLRVGSLVMALARRRSAVGQAVDRPRLWLEFLDELLQDLAEIDLGALAALEPCLDVLKDRMKQRLAEAA